MTPSLVQGNEVRTTYFNTGIRHHAVIFSGFGFLWRHCQGVSRVRKPDKRVCVAVKVSLVVVGCNGGP